jgi:hypothetical protein
MAIRCCLASRCSLRPAPVALPSVLSRVLAISHLARASLAVGPPPATATSNSSAPSCPQLTPTAGRVLLQQLRPSVSAAIDLARARGRIPSGKDEDEQTRMPGEPTVYVGSGAHAANIDMLGRLGMRAVLNLAPSVCRGPVQDYDARGMAYLQLSARDDRNFPLLDTFFKPASEFIASAHAEGGAWRASIGPRP